LSPLRKPQSKTDDSSSAATAAVAGGVDLLGSSNLSASSPINNEHTSDLYNLVFGATDTPQVDQVSLLYLIT
jgi:hypothetical protein